MNIIAITNVHVFDGTKLSKLKTVVIEDGFISSKTTGDIVVDGQGGTLLPGLIDSHIHMNSIENLKMAANYGVTTMLDMGNPSHKLVDSLRNLKGLTDIRSCYLPASAQGGIQTTKMGFPISSVVNGPNDAERFVAQQVGYGADYIKIIIEDPAVMGSAALDTETVAAIVESTHRYNKQTFAHVANVAAFNIAINANVDVLSHAPLDAPLSKDMAESMAEKGLLSVPTLVMMEGMTDKFSKLPTHKAIDYHNVEITVKILREAGVPIAAGTDANTAPGSFLNLNHGESLHEELELLVSSGFTPAQAIQSATGLPAKLFGLNDRGCIEIGKRADLVLVEGDPTLDIKVTKAIKGVWIAGEQVR